MSSRSDAESSISSRVSSYRKPLDRRYQHAPIAHWWSPVSALPKATSSVTRIRRTTVTVKYRALGGCLRLMAFCMAATAKSVVMRLPHPNRQSAGKINPSRWPGIASLRLSSDKSHHLPTLDQGPLGWNSDWAGYLLPHHCVSVSSVTL